MVKEEIRQLVKNHSFCSIVNRRFADSDLNKKDLVILATGDHTLHKRIATLAGAKEILVNVADTPDLCDFYLGSILSRGNFRITSYNVCYTKLLRATSFCNSGSDCGRIRNESVWK